MANVDLNNFKFFFHIEETMEDSSSAGFWINSNSLFPLGADKVLLTGMSFLCDGRFSSFQCEVLNMSMLHFNFWNQSLHTR